MREVKMPSGAVLKVAPAPFTDSRDLYQAFLREVKTIKFNPNDDIDVNFFKDLVCSGLSSNEVQSSLDKCAARCIYKGLKIDADSFEPVENRQDYLLVMIEIAKENIMPFTKSLYAQYGHILETVLGKNPA